MFSILEKEDIKCYLDIGANTGEFRNNVVKKIPTIKKSFLIEPEEVNYNFLVNHVDEKSSCVFFKIAIGYNSNLKCSILKSSNVGGHQIQKDDPNGQIELKTLEDLNIPVADLVKIDVEGMEYEIIINSKYLKMVKWMDVEFHQDPKDVREILDTNLPNFEIVLYQNGEGIEYGRCLLRNNS
jgi:FkbM family methyltransferase